LNRFNFLCVEQAVPHLSIVQGDWVIAAFQVKVGTITDGTVEFEFFITRLNPQ
jgi:hypothetical protein